MDRRGTETLTLIVGLVLALIILVVLMVFLSGGFQRFGKQTTDAQLDVESRLCAKQENAECVIGKDAVCQRVGAGPWIDCSGQCCVRQAATTTA